MDEAVQFLIILKSMVLTTSIFTWLANLKSKINFNCV
jgi:hypothetical protein